MRRINRPVTPDFWEDYKKRHKTDCYDDLQKTEEGCNVRHQLREFLIKSQYGLCAYCCKAIDVNTSSNEHMKPKGVSTYAKYSMDYNNIIASCNTNDTCTSKKNNHYDESLYISPLSINCAENFSFMPNGEIVGETPQGEYMINLLGLNSYGLVKARLAQLKTCQSYNDESLIDEYYLTPQDGRLEQFCDMIQYFYDLGEFTVKE